MQGEIRQGYIIVIITGISAYVEGGSANIPAYALAPLRPLASQSASI